MNQSKLIKFSFSWDRMSQGEFPTEMLHEVDSTISVLIEPVDTKPFKKKVTVSLEIPEEESELTIAFEIGRLIQSHVSNRYK